MEEKKTIKIGPNFSSTHFKKMAEYEDLSDYKGTRCKDGKSMQIYESILNEINLQKRFKSEDIKKIYFADDSLFNHKLTHMVITRKMPKLTLQRFILRQNKEIEPNKVYSTEGVGINSLNALLSKYVNDKSKRVDPERGER